MTSAAKKRKAVTAADVVAFVQSRGSDASEVRDAAHEACHALVCDMKGPWEREALHRAMARYCRGKRRGDALARSFSAECLARAVEWIVCERFGVAYDINAWVCTTLMEGIKFRYRYAGVPLEAWVNSIERLKGSTEAIGMADRILALAGGR